MRDILQIETVTITRYANYSTPNNIGKNICDPETNLLKTFFKFFKWFHENDMKANKNKCHFL